jgi:hypothetical protein
MTDRLREAAHQVLRMLVDGEYHEVAELTEGVRLPADEIRKAITDYGRKLVLPPVGAYEELDAIEIKGSNPPSWSMSIPLWTEEEARSDLTLEMTVTLLDSAVSIELDDIHVL